jgi:PhnB protein
MRLEAYLFFNGRTEEALAFYAEAIGAETLSLLRFKDSPEATNATPEWQDKVMHATFSIGSSVIMASDGVHAAPQKYSGFSVSIIADDFSSGEKMFAALSKGGEIRMPWQPTFWTKGFGMISDKFGMPWMVAVDDDL